MTMPENDERTIKRLVDKLLLQAAPPDSVGTLFGQLNAECQDTHISFDPAMALEYWWHLARLGVVATPAGEVPTIQDVSIPRLLVTARGRALLERGEKSPHDPPRYMKAVRERVGKPDEIALGYLDEAVGAWTAGLYRASAVMLGCACERLVLLLAAEIVRADIKPWADKIKKEQGRGAGVSRLFDLIRKCLVQLRGEKKLPGNLADALDRKLSAIFDHARALRNESGHPTGTDISADDAEAGLLLFPGFHSFAVQLCEQLSNHTASTIDNSPECP